MGGGLELARREGVGQLQLDGETLRIGILDDVVTSDVDIDLRIPSIDLAARRFSLDGTTLRLEAPENRQGKESSGGREFALFHVELRGLGVGVKWEGEENETRLIRPARWFRRQLKDYRRSVR